MVLDLQHLSLDKLDQLTADSSWSWGSYITAACLLEAAAPKAGNVHPSASFHDMDYEDFQQSALAIGQLFDFGKCESIGGWVFDAVKETQDKIKKNTNLGIILLLGPLLFAAKQLGFQRHKAYRDRLKLEVESKLSLLDASDSAFVYQAITIAKPGGMGSVEKMDIRQEPPRHLQKAMRLAAEWDDVAKQYATGFSDVFELSTRLDKYHHKTKLGWLGAIVVVQAERLASHGDTLIARKNDQATVQRVHQLANEVFLMEPLRSKADARQKENRQVQAKKLSLNSVENIIDRKAWDRLDDFLRGDGNRRNPGTTADLIAAAIFVSLLNEYNT